MASDERDKQWEYRFVAFDGTQVERLNELGADGWECVGIAGGVFAVMKRVVITSDAA